MVIQPPALMYSWKIEVIGSCWGAFPKWCECISDLVLEFNLAISRLRTLSEILHQLHVPAGWPPGQFSVSIIPSENFQEKDLKRRCNSECMRSVCRYHYTWDQHSEPEVPQILYKVTNFNGSGSWSLVSLSIRSTTFFFFFFCLKALQVWLDALSLALYNPAAPTDSLFLKWLHRREQRFGFLPCLIFSAYNNARFVSSSRKWGGKKKDLWHNIVSQNQGYF